MHERRKTTTSLDLESPLSKNIEYRLRRLKNPSAQRLKGFWDSSFLFELNGHASGFEHQSQFTIQIKMHKKKEPQFQRNADSKNYKSSGDNIHHQSQKIASNPRIFESSENSIHDAAEQQGTATA